MEESTEIKKRESERKNFLLITCAEERKSDLRGDSLATSLDTHFEGTPRAHPLEQRIEIVLVSPRPPKLAN